MWTKKKVIKGKTYYALYAGNKFVKHIGNAAAYRKYLKDIGRKENELAALKGTVSQPDMPAEIFDVIYADPPWKYNDAQAVGTYGTGTGAAVSHYPAIPLSELKALDIQGEVP